jgi:hypothetical protein
MNQAANFFGCLAAEGNISTTAADASGDILDQNWSTINMKNFVYQFFS